MRTREDGTKSAKNQKQAIPEDQVTQEETVTISTSSTTDDGSDCHSEVMCFEDEEANMMVISLGDEEHLHQLDSYAGRHKEQEENNSRGNTDPIAKTPISTPFIDCKNGLRFFIKCIGGRISRCTVRVLLISAILFLVFTIVVFVGAEVEGRKIQKTASTAWIYETEAVCAIDSLAATSILETFETATDANESGKEVAHCGECGSCSNLKDIDIMAKTRATLTETTTECAKKVFFGGRSAVASCMSANVGFSDACADCWIDNVECTKRNCKFTCIKTLLFFREGNNEASGGLKACLECDEKMCGPDFIQCSGANRRRLRIVSDIARDVVHEQCHAVDLDWTQETD